MGLIHFSMKQVEEPMVLPRELWHQASTTDRPIRHDVTHEMDLHQLLNYYRCFSIRDVTITKWGNMVPCPSGAVREGRLFEPPEECRASPLVLKRGSTVEIHTGHGADFGHAGGAYTTLSGERGRHAFRYRNTYLRLTGPLTALQVLQALSKHVALEAGRNQLLVDALFHGRTDADGGGSGLSGLHLSAATQEQRARYAMPPGDAGLAPESVAVLELSPDPFQPGGDVSEDVLLAAADRAGLTTCLETIEQLPAAPTGGRGEVKQYMARWSKPFC